MFLFTCTLTKNYPNCNPRPMQLANQSQRETCTKRIINNEEALKRNKIFIQDTCWHRTGDSGFMDDDGKLYLTGRLQFADTLYKGQILAPFVYRKLSYR
ncbi:MAG: hypothetical protein IPP46_20630 [Bacteroidetes bacterium]|nr:hypothetical protein [Bacteroidota bacterium]